MEVFPVVHINGNNIKTAVNESEKAFELGADGVFLIDHHNGYQNTKPLFDTFNEAIRGSSDRYIGVNILGASPYIAMRSLATAIKTKELMVAPSALWVDDMRIDQSPDTAIELRNSDYRLRYVKLLGGAAFKYTDTYTDDPDLARYWAAWTKDRADIVTTSGSATGKPASVEKLRAMKEAVGDQLLAVASGISAENIHLYEGIVDQVLVSSSIETTPGSGMFNQDKLAELIRIAHSLAR